QNNGTEVMKRVVGLPGESIRISRRRRIYINGKEIEPPEGLKFLSYLPFGNLTDGDPVSCSDGYYVLGDDTIDSDDSRFNGPIKRDQLVGRAWLIINPDSRRGFVNPNVIY
ncbi:MAG: signal peptidase I, partial [Planctomycetales bacterium]